MWVFKCAIWLSTLCMCFGIKCQKFKISIKHFIVCEMSTFVMTSHFTFTRFHSRCSVNNMVVMQSTSIPFSQLPRNLSETRYTSANVFSVLFSVSLIDLSYILYVLFCDFLIDRLSQSWHMCCVLRQELYHAHAEN